MTDAETPDAGPESNAERGGILGRIDRIGPHTQRAILGLGSAATFAIFGLLRVVEGAIGEAAGLGVLALFCGSLGRYYQTSIHR